jgi:putative intracellular protease/amidase
MRVGMPVYPQVDVLDVAGPWEMLSWAKFDITIAAQQAGRIVCRGGFLIEADTSFADAPPFEVLWVPGGAPASLNTLMGDRVFLDYLIKRAEGAKYVCSVCEGALLLAATGLLNASSTDSPRCAWRRTIRASGWMKSPCLEARNC